MSDSCHAPTASHLFFARRQLLCRGRLWRSHRENGSGLAEFSLIALPLLFTGMGVVELAHWVYVRQAVGAALINSARAGSTQHAHPAAIAQGFEQGLLSLHPPKPGRTSSQQLAAAKQRFFAQNQTLPWHIQLTSPNTLVYNDFSNLSPSTTSGSSTVAGSNFPRIRNSYQHEQHQQALAKGWPRGLGPVSGKTVFQANTLSLRLNYHYRPLMPGFSWLTGPYLTIRRETQVVMHSDPILWPDGTHAQVSRTAQQLNGIPARPITNSPSSLNPFPATPSTNPQTGQDPPVHTPDTPALPGNGNEATPQQPTTPIEPGASDACL